MLLMLVAQMAAYRHRFKMFAGDHFDMIKSFGLATLARISVLLVTSSPSANFASGRGPWHIATMSRQRGKLHRGRAGRTVNNRDWVATDGYGEGVSIPVQLLIDNWEARLLAVHLSSGKNEGRINHYWLVKNMFEALMEDTKANWDKAKNTTQTMKAHLAQMESLVVNLDTTFGDQTYAGGSHVGGSHAWGSHAGGSSVGAVGGPGEHCAAVGRGDTDPVLSAPHGKELATNTFPIPSTIGQLAVKRVRGESEKIVLP